MKRIIASLMTVLAVSTDLTTSARAADSDQERTKPVILISDIDDTVKATHIRGGAIAMGLGALDAHSPFLGMKELYAKVKSHNAYIAFLSAAPGPTQYFGINFLVTNGFPVDAFSGRESIFEDKAQFKSKEFLALWNLTSLFFKDGQFETVFVGDNGEQDVEAYQLAYNTIKSKERPVGSKTKNIHSFIHYVYSTGAPIPWPQTAFVTAADLAVHFYALNLISQSDLKAVVESVLAAMRSIDVGLREGVIPAWLDCKGFSQMYKRPAANLEPSLAATLLDVENRVMERCERGY